MSCKACPDHDSKEFKILCPNGRGKDNNGADINECNQTPGICAHGTCENLNPGFRCLCDPGFHTDENGICQDIDECEMHQSVSISDFKDLFRYKRYLYEIPRLDRRIIKQHTDARLNTVLMIAKELDVL